MELKKRLNSTTLSSDPLCFLKSVDPFENRLINPFPNFSFLRENNILRKSEILVLNEEGKLFQTLFDDVGNFRALADKGKFVHFTLTTTFSKLLNETPNPQIMKGFLFHNPQVDSLIEFQFSSAGSKLVLTHLEEDTIIYIMKGTQFVVLIPEHYANKMSWKEKDELRLVEDFETLRKVEFNQTSIYTTCRDLYYATLSNGERLFVPKNWKLFQFNWQLTLSIWHLPNSTTVNPKHQKIEINARNTFHQFPLDIWFQIMQYLPPKDLLTLCETSTLFFVLASKEEIWKKHYFNVFCPYTPTATEISKHLKGSWKSLFRETIQKICINLRKNPMTAFNDVLGCDELNLHNHGYILFYLLTKGYITPKDVSNMEMIERVTSYSSFIPKLPILHSIRMAFAFTDHYSQRVSEFLYFYSKVNPEVHVDKAIVLKLWKWLITSPKCFENANFCDSELSKSVYEELQEHHIFHAPESKINTKLRGFLKNENSSIKYCKIEGRNLLIFNHIEDEKPSVILPLSPNVPIKSYQDKISHVLIVGDLLLRTNSREEAEKWGLALTATSYFPYLSLPRRTEPTFRVVEEP